MAKAIPALILLLAGCAADPPADRSGDIEYSVECPGDFTLYCGRGWDDCEVRCL